ncbi:hypothetical protein BC834DRAFT_905945 [Gloeopeniophorella convolvens]|nr:hypothetical protein BC834DRAFT_905945 [Gloeopeniophorella convolvens]
MPISSVWDFLDISATRDDHGFFIDLTGSDTDEQDFKFEQRSSPSLPTHEARALEAAELEQQASRYTASRAQPRVPHRTPRALPRLPRESEFDLLAHVPLETDPGIWCFQVKRGFERDLVYQIARRCLTPTEHAPPRINHAFSRDCIAGYIFIEAPTLPDARRAVDGLTTVRQDVAPRLIELEWRVQLFQRRSPTASTPRPGQWVRALCGPYRGDVGFVCNDIRPVNENLVIVFVPRLPTRTSIGRPEAERPPARLWTESDVVHEWGSSRVKSFGQGRFDFFSIDGDRIGLGFECGLALWPLPISHAVREDTDAIESGTRVIGLFGSLKGVVGQVSRAAASEVSLVVQRDAGNSERYDSVPKRDLFPHMAVGDNVKDRWSSSAGTVVQVNYDDHSLVYLEIQTLSEIATRTYEVEKHDPAVRSHPISIGSWVEFGSSILKRGVVIASPLDDKVRVEEEHTKDVYDLDFEDVRFAAVQNKSAPVLGLHWPERVGKEMIVVGKVPRKGHVGTVKSCSEDGAMVQFHSDYATNSATQEHFILWDHVFMRPTLGPHAPRTRASPPPGRSATPPPEPGASRSAATPPPEPGPSHAGSAWEIRERVYERAEDHWIHHAKVREVMTNKRLALSLRDPNGTKTQIGQSAKTVVLSKRTIEPGPGEVVVNIVRRKVARQVAVDPRTLVPWEPGVGDQVIVVHGTWFGWVGKVEEVADGPSMRFYTVIFDESFPLHNRIIYYTWGEIVSILDT